MAKEKIAFSEFLKKVEPKNQGYVEKLHSNLIAQGCDNVINAELERGYAKMKAGRTKSASKAFADIHKDYNL